jgi:Protein of unknown function (DUF2934)
MKIKSKGLDDKGIQSEGPCLDPEERHRMIAEAAYFMAESRGFCGDVAVKDWLDAEAEIDRIYRSQKSSTEVLVL